MSPEGWEIFFNSICLGLALLLATFVFILYRGFQPKFYGLLFWALFLTLCASLTYGLYSSLLDAFLAMKSTDGAVMAAKTRLSENMRVFAFVVPGLMLAVAANLITTFLQAPKPKA